jgi:hypothetical protein
VGHVAELAADHVRAIVESGQPAPRARQAAELPSAIRSKEVGRSLIPVEVGRAAALSIIVDAPPLEHPEDATALLSTLIHTGWRHVPPHQNARAARRMARFVSDSLTEQVTWRGQTY